jgi:hypothetical protein
MRQKRVREESRIEVGSGSDSVVGTQECTWRETCGTTKSARIFRSRMRSRTLVISHPNDALHFVSTFPLQALEPARRRTANSAERNLTAVMAVPHPGLWEKSAASIVSNGSTSLGDFSEIEATIHRPGDARSDDDGNRAALLSDLREYLTVAVLDWLLQRRGREI